MRTLVRRRRPLCGALAMAVALAALAGCAGDGDGDEGSSATTTTTEAASSSTGGVPTGPPGAGSPTTSGATVGAGGSTRGGAAAGVAPTSAPRSGPGGPSAGTPPRDGAAAPTGATRPGRYRYASTGTFSVGAGAEQPRSGESVLTVDPVAGSDQHSLRQGVNRSTEQVLRYQADGIHIVFLKVSEQGLTKEFRPSPPVLALPAGAAPGRTWSWRMTSVDGQTTVDANFRIEGKESVQVGRDPVPSVVVRATMSTSGDLTSKGVQTLWVAEDHGLVTREQSVTEGTFGGIPFRSTHKEDLLHLNPA